MVNKWKSCPTGAKHKELTHRYTKLLNQRNPLWSKSGVAGEGKLVSTPKFHFWGKCIMTITNIHSD